jgi:hypothetical protein
MADTSVVASIVIDGIVVRLTHIQMLPVRKHVLAAAVDDGVRTKQLHETMNGLVVELIEIGLDIRGDLLSGAVTCFYTHQTVSLKVTGLGTLDIHAQYLVLENLAFHLFVDTQDVAEEIEYQSPGAENEKGKKYLL